MNIPTASPTAASEPDTEHPTRAPRAARHLHHLDDISEVPTSKFKKAQVQLADTVRDNGVAVAYGRPGTGKTFAVDYFMRHNKVMADRTWHWLDMPRKPAPKEVTMRLLHALGVKFRRGDVEYVLTEDLIPVLLETNPVVVIDEAHHLGGDGLQQLRYFHDRCRPILPDDPPGFTLVLVGSTVDVSLGGADELDSRVSAWIDFHPLEPEPLLSALRAWHPLLAELPPELLLQIDRERCRGNFRRWAQFLNAYARAHHRRPPSTDDERRNVAAIALAAISKSGKSSKKR